ncbi:hypothetical protein RN001_005216 [Aquatica leii]|uniref:Uncharacterized protein n=1 Tax=Aquatica leii TaxID=1421715 RepID=A0AAN7SHS7_9COLE|nr:hypothetical protein RN001_005216 [Aquatica leii]
MNIKYIFIVSSCFLIKLSVQDKDSMKGLDVCIKEENLDIPDFKALVEVLRKNDMDSITRIYGCILRKIGFSYEIRAKIIDTCQEQTAGESHKAYTFVNCWTQLTRDALANLN